MQQQLQSALKSVRASVTPLHAASAAAAGGAIAVVAAGYPEALALMAGVALVALYGTGGKMHVALLCAAAAAVAAAVLQTTWTASLPVGSIVEEVSRQQEEEEGFKGGEEEEEVEHGEEEEKDGPAPAPAADSPSKRGKAPPSKGRRGVPPPPNNRDKREMLELGKKYEVPHEDDDGEYHLDSGSTFLHAYKSLKPDQVASMTKDTQELMETQKQLMATLHTLKPLITDGKDMLNMFNSYFGEGAPATS